MTVGFKGFAKPQKVENLQASLDNLAEDEYVFYTGGKYGRRRQSGRSASLATITEVKKPVPIREYAKRAATAGPGGTGFPTSISIAGLGLHAGAKPAVYLYLVKDAEGNFRAKKDIPNPDRSFSETPFKAGDVVIPATKKALTQSKGQSVTKK